MGKTTSTVDFEQISNVMESSAKIINNKKTLTIFAKHFTIDIWQGSEQTSGPTSSLFPDLQAWKKLLEAVARR